MLEIEPGYREVVHCSTYAPYLPYLPSFKLAEVSQVAKWRSVILLGAMLSPPSPAECSVDGDFDGGGDGDLSLALVKLGVERAISIPSGCH